MNLRPLLLLAALALSIPALVTAQTPPPIPIVIEQGFDAYAQNGLTSALDTWGNHSLLDRAALFKSEVPALKLADANFGLFERGEVVRTVAVTGRLTRVYVVLYYERAPLWAWFDLYTTRQGKQVISEVFFSPKLHQVLPEDILER